MKDLQLKPLHNRNSPTTHFHLLMYLQTYSCRPTLSIVPSPLKLDWNCAVWISSSGVYVYVCVCVCVCVHVWVGVILSLRKSWIYFWLFSGDWTGNETAYWPWRFIWTSLVIVEGFRESKKVFFFCVTTYTQIFHPWDSVVWMADSTHSVYQLETHFTSVRMSLYWSGLVIY